jgi:hypothetical protein
VQDEDLSLRSHVTRLTPPTTPLCNDSDMEKIEYTHCHKQTLSVANNSGRWCVTNVRCGLATVTNLRCACSGHGLSSCGMRNTVMAWQRASIPVIISGRVIAFSFSLFLSLVSSIDSNPQLLEQRSSSSSSLCRAVTWCRFQCNGTGHNRKVRYGDDCQNYQISMVTIENCQTW